jgi:hypothetical protein
MSQIAGKLFGSIGTPQPGTGSCLPDFPQTAGPGYARWYSLQLVRSYECLSRRAQAGRGVVVALPAVARAELRDLPLAA